MSEQGRTGSGNEPEGTRPSGASRSSDGAGRLPSWALAAAPAVALVVGVVLGVVLTSVGDDSSGDAENPPTSSASDTSSPGVGDVAVVVPSECGEAAETVQEATSLIRENVAAIREFRTKDIVDFLNQLEDLDQQAREQAQTCSQVDVSTVSPSPTS